MRVAGFLFGLVLFLVGAAMQVTPEIQNAQAAYYLWIAAGVVLALTVISIPAEWLWKRRRTPRMPEKHQDEDPPISFSIGTNTGQIAGVNRGLMHQTVHQHGLPPRTLRGHDLSAVRRHIERFRGTSIDVGCVLGDGEGHQLAEEIMELLRSAGWQLSGAGLHQVVLSTPAVGVEIHTQSDEFPEALRALAEGLMSVGIETTGGVQTGVRPAPIVIVGTRPG